FDHRADPDEDADLLGDTEYKPVVDELMDGYVRPFLTVPPARPHKNPFAR
ncbi:MAG: hypothetical protein QOH10_2021, partial [Actinomycetota bacterium]|nr:hypothetical protein [Actinomycetota bacterium]